jgi:uncharacterized protein (TIGR00251 family)
MRLEVKVLPRSSREELVREGGVLKAYVKAAPDKGKANKALIELIAREYKVRKSDVRIVKGRTGRNKIVEVTTG